MAPPVVVEPGPISEEEEREARGLLESARASFEARRLYEALRTAGEVLDRFPASRASGEALRLTAIAHYEAGQAEEGREAAERYLALLPPDDPRATDLLYLQATAAEGDPATRLDRLLRIPALTDPARTAEATAMVREAVDSLAVDTAQAVVRDAP
ncbi:MAG: hypothetical protein GWO00_12370, partial [Gemmatimonadetes bacterium]|nr:hypothetical protein [Actinomycetota bacterium]NIR79127.1 hypothetical protein [Gemmatimonadota bacterium]NIT87780.1 hypothetical protein [Gemmatimonadota bacterium]NIU31643.1 hypothetical protein [Gemmatimonadota bacterium]NIV61989.1 hypothetical protein [Gemmatimonadota bacterium]